VIAFLKTRAAADHIYRHVPNDRTRRSALAVLSQLNRCEAAVADQTGNGNSPVTISALLRGLISATADLAGPEWLTAHHDDPAAAGFTALRQADHLPDPVVIDDVLSGLLWARYAPARPQQNP
jgi:hypothetical protein